MNKLFQSVFAILQIRQKLFFVSGQLKIWSLTQKDNFHRVLYTYLDLLTMEKKYFSSIELQ